MNLRNLSNPKGDLLSLKVMEFIRDNWEAGGGKAVSYYSVYHRFRYKASTLDMDIRAIVTEMVERQWLKSLRSGAAGTYLVPMDDWLALTESAQLELEAHVGLIRFGTKGLEFPERKKPPRKKREGPEITIGTDQNAIE
jgi:hypothetical protein